MRAPACGLLITLMMLASAPAAATRLAPDLADLQAVPQLRLPPASVAKLVQAAERRKHLPLQFAVGLPVTADLAAGLWDEAAPGVARWRLRLQSTGARSLHVHFRHLQLPPQATLWFYDEQARRMQGPLQSEAVASALVTADQAVLELRVPQEQRDQVRLELATVFHGYDDIRSAGKAGPRAKAGACERDVACPEGEAWRDQIRSVALLEFGGFLCSGQLLNNTRGDQAPFLLTANHCGISAAEAGTVVAYFNFQRPACGGGEGSLEQTVSGASLVRSDSESDTTLLTLSRIPPASYGVFYSGWDASGGAVNSGAGLHHPQGDEKSISLFNAAAQREDNVCASAGANGGCDLEVDAWIVRWASGVTEQGSSGSGLWNQNRRLVGVLSGGASDCNGASGNGEPDAYGRFDVAWARGLRAELDAANSGATALDGICAGGGATCGDRGSGGENPVIPGSGGGGAYGGSSAGLFFSLLGLFAVWLRRRPGTE